jgi:hypothetical protein
MSTKTTFKRVALVAVAAMGFGVLTSVAPASAVAIAPTGITAGSVGPTRVGVATTVNFAVAHAVGDTYTVAATLTAKPALSTGTVLLVATGTTSTTTLTRLNRATANLYGNATVAGASASATVSTGTATVANAANTTTYVAVTLTPDVAGDYQILLSTGNASYTAGDKSAVISISTAGAPATATMTTIQSVIATSGTYGSPIKVVLKDANGVVTKPNSTESINLTVTSGSATLGGAATIALAGTAFASGSATTMIKDSTAEDTVVVTSSGGGTLASTTTLASTLAMTSSKTSATVVATASVWQQGTGVATTGFKLDSQTSLIFPSTATSQSIGLGTLTANGTAGETTATATKYTTITVTDTDGGITSGPGAGNAYDVVVSQAGGGATKTSALSVTATLGTTYRYSVTTTVTGATSNTLVVTGATPVATTTGAISPAVVNSALLGTNTFTSKITDQFGSAIANAAVVATVSAGRNATKAAVNMLSDASGYVSYTLTDSGTNGTSDTILFDGATDVNATVNYGVATVSTATLTGGNTTAGVTSPTNTTYDITAGDGAEGGVQTFTVTVKDVNGALLSGLPVVWTVSGTTAAITSNSATGYTTSAGTDSASVYAWVAGTYTVTATVGGKAATGTITFGQTGAGEERSISAKASGPVVTATVVDRFGNPVPGVTVYATKTGVGYFGAGTTKTSGTTDTLGTVDFVITGGSADVKVSTLSYSATAGTCPSGQTGALKGNADCTADPADATAFTAAAAGTAIKAEVGVGVSFDAAGVSSATASVEIADNASTAADAAAEATDAANAATDAANAAAEAADAATAAAQDAADAVAALSAQVATLISGLKSQLTALTNLVIKIQKKVKA